MSRNDDDSSLLLKDGSFVKFERLLQRAEKEGRVKGSFNCLICGMRYQTKRESVACCSLATEYPAPIPGPIIGSFSKTRLPAKKPSAIPRLKVADMAPDTALTLNGSMLEVLNTINLSELLPEEAIVRNAENDGVLLVCLLSILLEEANGDRKRAFQIARQNGLTMHPRNWGKLVARLVKLGVLIPITAQNNHHASDIGNGPQSGEAVESEKESKE